MAHDSPRELQDLTTVNHFYLGLLEKTLGHGVPIPLAIQNAGSSEAPGNTVNEFKNWLDLMDLAITPPVVRDTLKSTSGYEIAHALLRYLAEKASPRSGDRDKMDCVITYLFRNPPHTMAVDLRHGSGLRLTAPTSLFPRQPWRFKAIFIARWKAWNSVICRRNTRN